MNSSYDFFMSLKVKHRSMINRSQFLFDLE